MSKFDTYQIDCLKTYLYHSHIHDAKIDFTHYDEKNKKLTIETINEIYRNRMIFVFEDVDELRCVKGNWPGDSRTVISLTVEKSPYVQNSKNIISDHVRKPIYLLFQMLSGDEMHIVARSVEIEETVDTSSPRE